jgi:hypothetical protein
MTSKNHETLRHALTSSLLLPLFLSRPNITTTLFSNTLNLCTQKVSPRVIIKHPNLLPLKRIEPGHLGDRAGSPSLYRLGRLGVCSTFNVRPTKHDRNKMKWNKIQVKQRKSDNSYYKPRPPLVATQTETISFGLLSSPKRSSITQTFPV